MGMGMVVDRDADMDKSERQNCSLPHQRVHEIKHMYPAPRTHGLFIT
jgi:hypothetical protein